MLASLSAARRRLVHALIAVVAVAAVVVAVVVVRTAGGETHPVAQGPQGPVLLVPGYGGSLASLQSLAGRLRSAGRDATVVALPGNAMGDLSSQAKTVGSAAAAAMKRTGAHSVDIVGYSAGGVVARLWVREQGGAGKARRIVTLGSPQHGTDLATAGSAVPGACPVACQQLEPNSELLNRLNAGDETPAGPEFVSIWTSADQVVQPPDSARLTGARNIVVQDVCRSSQIGHGQLPTDRAVQGMVLAELDGAQVRGFSSSDCAQLSS